MADLTEVIICYNDLDAEIVKGSLERAGIDVFISKDDCGGMEPQLQMTEGIKVMVPSAQAAKARLVLDGIESRTNTGPENGRQWQCESCGELLDPQFTDCWNCGAAKEK